MDEFAVYTESGYTTGNGVQVIVKRDGSNVWHTLVPNAGTKGNAELIVKMFQRREAENA